MDITKPITEYSLEDVFALCGTASGLSSFQDKLRAHFEGGAPQGGQSTPAQVLARLGYDDAIFESDAAHKITVFEKTAAGLLAYAHLIGDLAEALADFKNPNTANMFRRLSRAADGSIAQNDIAIVIPSLDVFDYQTFIAGLASLPRNAIQNLSGEKNLALATTMRHEIRHLDMPPTGKAGAGADVEVEAYCDMMPLMDFASVAGKSAVEGAFSDLKAARSIAPILVGLWQMRKEGAVSDEVFDHATMPLLVSAVSQDYDDMGAGGAQVVAAYREAVELLYAHEDTREAPDFVRAYRSAKSLLLHPDIQSLASPLAILTIESFAEAVEHFSPGYAAKAMAPEIVTSGPDHADEHITEDAPDARLDIAL